MQKKPYKSLSYRMKENPMQHWYSFYLLTVQGTKFDTQKPGCLWFITEVPRALTFSGSWINETFQIRSPSRLQVDIQAGSKFFK